jgi:EmrB/QacA subfamily drug resistance transporter
LTAAAPFPNPLVKTTPGPILVAAVLASSMGFIDSSVTALALPSIRFSLGATQAQAEWVGAAYLLTLCSLILSGGALGDRFGTLQLFRSGIIGFMAASVLCALAPSPALLIAARALQGVAAAAMVPGSMAIIAKAYPQETRGQALGTWTAAATATTIAGPMLGGLILSLLGPHAWRLIFALNLPFGAGALWLLHRYARPDKGLPGTPVDIAGAALATLSLGALAAGLSFGGLWLLALAALAFAAFLRVQATSPAPMIPLTMFRNRAFAGANAATLLLYFGVMGLNFYLPTVALTAWGLKPWQMTLAILPGSVLIATISPWAGRMADRIGPGAMMATGAGIVAVAQLLMTRFAGTGPFLTHMQPFMILQGVGMSLVVAPLTAAVMAHAGASQMGAASGINNAMARIATLIGIALMGRLARGTYDGFGSNAADVAASTQAFHRLALAAAICSALAALICAIWVRRSPKR